MKYSLYNIHGHEPLPILAAEGLSFLRKPPSSQNMILSNCSTVTMNLFIRAIFKLGHFEMFHNFQSFVAPVKFEFKSNSQ